MNKYIIKYGSIVGGITSIGLISMIFTNKQGTFEYAELIGYLVMLVAFSFLYLGAKNYRDTVLNGSITFGKGFTLGLLMALVAATIYVLTWLIVYYGFIPDFMERYATTYMEKMKNTGASDYDMAVKLKEIKQMQEMYKNPLWVILITYSEILPVGILVALVTSLVLRKAAKPELDSETKK